MTPQAALIQLLARVGARNGAALLVSAEELSEWPAVAVAAMKSQKLLTKARPAISVVCPGSERECVMPVHTVPAGLRGPVSFIVCDTRSDINRVPVSAGRQKQWRRGRRLCPLAMPVATEMIKLGLAPRPSFGSWRGTCR